MQKIIELVKVTDFIRIKAGVFFSLGNSINSPVNSFCSQKKKPLARMSQKINHARDSHNHRPKGWQTG